MNSSISEYVRTLRRLPLFNDLSDSELALIAADVSRLHFEQGTVIFGEGDVCHELLIVEEGEAKLVKSALNGRQQPLGIERKGSALAEVSDVLFIQSIELSANYRGKGIGAQVVRETIATFGSHCGLIACKPFPLQYSNGEDEEHSEPRKEPGFEEKRLADFARVARFWTDLGFVRLDDSDFYTHLPEVVQQPGPASDIAPFPVVNRVPRGRRRRQFRYSRVFLVHLLVPALTC